MSPSEPERQGGSIPFDSNPVGDEPQTETEGTGTTEPQEPTGEKQPPPEPPADEAEADRQPPEMAGDEKPPADPVADAVNRITQAGLSNRRFIARVRQVERPVAEHPHFTATVDRELRLRLLARLEDGALG